MLLNRIDFRMRKYEGTPGTVYCDIYAVDGSHFPTGGSLAQASIAAFTNYPAWEWKAFVFGSPADLTIGTEYVALLTSPASSSLLTYEISFDHTGPYADGGMVRYVTMWGWYAQNDCCFKAYSGGEIQIQITEGCVSLTRWGKTSKVGMTFAFPSDDPPTAPTSLLCNGQSNPVDIAPQYFSAIYNDPNFGDIADNYRIQVNKASGFTGQMVWDSGKTAMSNVTEGQRCANINYDGQALSLNKITYYWRIKFWDDEGNEGAWSAEALFAMAGSGAGEMGSAPWGQYGGYWMGMWVMYPISTSPWNGGFGTGRVEIPKRSGQWTTLGDIMRLHTSVNKNPLEAAEIAQAEATCCNISKGFNSFDEASGWYKQLEGFALELSAGCMVAGTPISRKLFTGIITSVEVSRATQTAEIKIVDFLDYFGRVTIRETPVWENISLTQLYKNLVELAFSDWVEGVDYFVEDLGDITVEVISYENLNLLAELKHIAECRGMRIFTDVNGKLVCRSRNLEGDPWDIKHDYNLEDVSERRDISSVLNWIVVHARPHEVGVEPINEVAATVAPLTYSAPVLLDSPIYVPSIGGYTGAPILGPDVTASGKVAGFIGTPGFEKIDLSWWNPTRDDFSLTRIRGSIYGYPLNIGDGAQIVDKGGPPGSQQFHTSSGLTTSKRRYYSAFVQDKAGNWSEAAHCSAIPGIGGDTWADETNTSPVSAFRAEPRSGQVVLTWRNPDVYDFSLVRIRRSESSYPSSPTSGSPVYEGSGETDTDTGLINGVTYYYSAFAKNTAGRYSSASFISATPGGTRRTLQSEIIQGGQDSVRTYWCSLDVGGYTCKWIQVEGALFATYTYTTKLRFNTKDKFVGWLRFRHLFDVSTHAPGQYSSNERHAVGTQDDIAVDNAMLSCGGVAGVRLTRIGVYSSGLEFEYKLTMLVGKVTAISFRNTLSLRG